MHRKKHLHYFLNVTIALLGFGFNAISSATNPSSNTTENLCANKIDSCHYYTCKASALGCDKENYFLKFGYKNCLQFEHDRHFFSKNGQQFLDRVRPCLQNQIESENAADLKCSNIEDYVYNHHVSCYIENGYCDLSSEDKRQITIEVHSSLFTNLKLFQTGLKIQKICRLKSATTALLN